MFSGSIRIFQPSTFNLQLPVTFPQVFRKFVPMAGNSIGTVFRLTTFGESHGRYIGGVIDGCPAGILIDVKFIQQKLDRRKPGLKKGATARKEHDKIEIIAGLFENVSTGAPIAFIIPNKNYISKDYDQLKDVYRPSHADFTYELKYGVRDYRGGGRASARETACRVAGGAVAKLLLQKENIEIKAFVSQIGSVKLNKNYQELDLNETENSPVLCPDKAVSDQMIKNINKAKTDGDSLGGVITCLLINVPLGLGEPVFDKLQADLAKAMLSINGVKGFEYGSGFGAAGMKGSSYNDPFIIRNGRIRTKTNHDGGIQGGISNGEDIYFNLSFKPVSSINKEQQTVDNSGNTVILRIQGRHDVCIVPRAVVIVESMAALTLADHMLRFKASES